MTMLDISMLCGKCKKAFETANAGGIVMLCKDCEGSFPNVVNQSDCTPIAEESERVKKTPSTFKPETRIEEEDEKNALTLQEELREKCDKFHLSDDCLRENGIDVTDRINPYGRREYDRGPESEGK